MKKRDKDPLVIYRGKIMPISEAEKLSRPAGILARARFEVMVLEAAEKRQRGASKTR